MGLLAGCGERTGQDVSKRARAPLKAAVAEVTYTAVASVYEAVGTVRPKTSSTIQSKAVGRVEAVLVSEGDVVAAGQQLIEIDSRDAIAQAERAESFLREAERARQEVEKSVEAAAYARAAADAASALAASTYERYQGLAEKQAVSQQALDEASAKWKGATAEAAKAGEMVFSAEARRGELDARVEQAKAGLSSAQTLLSYTKIAAPFAGIVTRKTVDAGDLAAPGVPLLEMEVQGQYRLEALVDEEHIAGVKAGDAVSAKLDALGENDLAGSVAEIVPAADPSSRSFVVKIDLPQEPGIRSGLFGRARFSLNEKKVLTVPALALEQRGQLAYVFVVGDGNVARLRLVTEGKRYGDHCEVLSGLDAGERVVVDGGARVNDGDVVVQP